MPTTSALQRSLAVTAYLLSLLSLAPNALGYSLTPAIWLWPMCMLANVALLAAGIRGRPFLAGHAIQAIVLQFAVYLPEVVGVILFIVLMLLGYPVIAMGAGRQSPLARAENLLEAVFALLFLGLAVHAIYRAASGKEYQVPLVGRPFAYLLRLVQRGPGR